MQLKTLTAILAVATSAFAQRPSNTSICDYYTTALLMNNTAENQYTLLTLLVNTAVIGNYTTPNVGIMVPGILNPNGMYNGTAINLTPYFDGGFASSNRGGSSGVAVNFLDGGGAAPLMQNMAANDMSSNQYTLLTHLYQYFGVLLGCSMQTSPMKNTNTSFPAYAGQGSQYNVHKFMDLNPYQMGYFITQVGLSAASFGVATDDVTYVGMALNSLFGYKCSPPTTVVPEQGAQAQSICQDETCPLAMNATCTSSNATMPAVANATLVGNATATMSMSMSSTSGMAMSTGAAGKVSVGGTLLGVVLFAWLL